MFNCDKEEMGWGGGGGEGGSRDVNQRSKWWCLLQGLYEPGQLCLTPCTELLSEGGKKQRGGRCDISACCGYCSA